MVNRVSASPSQQGILLSSAAIKRSLGFFLVTESFWKSHATHRSKQCRALVPNHSGIDKTTPLQRFEKSWSAWAHGASSWRYSKRFHDCLVSPRSRKPVSPANLCERHPADSGKKKRPVTRRKLC